MKAGGFPVHFFLALFVILSSCGGRAEPGNGAAAVSARELFVLCGAANQPPMEVIVRQYERARGIKVAMTFGGSGTLLSQCQLSGRGDIYLPGSPDYIIIGERKGLVIPKSDSIVVYLVPAIIVPRGNPKNIRTLEDLARPGVRVGIGNPETVCLGLYGIELLVFNRLLEKVMANVVTFGESCEKTADLAALGKVDAILGWSVFENWNPERMECIPISPDRIPRLSYVPIALPTTVQDTSLARDFIAFVMSPVGQAAFAGFGYHTSRAEAQKFAPAATVGGEYHLPDEYFALMRQRANL